MRAKRWWIGAAGAFAAGGVVAALVGTSACGSILGVDDCSVTGCPSIATCTLSKTGAAECVKNAVVAPMVDAGMEAAIPMDAGAEAAFGTGGPPAFPPGDGGLTSCANAVGTNPVSTCDQSDELGCAMVAGSGCVIDQKCTAGSAACEAFTTNNGKVDNFRMRLINITAPYPQLTSGFIEANVVAAAVDLPATPTACGENGQGLFNWLISVDTVNKTVTTGGAPQSTDPFGVGYCFFNQTIGSNHVGPVTTTATFTGNNTFTTAPLKETLNIPIFQKANNYTDVVILPISGAYFNDVTVSNDGNCIGAVNNNSLTPDTCVDSNPRGADSCSRWHTAGSLDGYITLANADMVPIALLNGESLCVLLLGLQGMTTCGEAVTKPGGMGGGNYCSTGGSCTDSFWLSADFAASAVTVNEDAGISVCAPFDAGGGSTGTDAGHKDGG